MSKNVLHAFAFIIEVESIRIALITISYSNVINRSPVPKIDYNIHENSIDCLCLENVFSLHLKFKCQRNAYYFSVAKLCGTCG